MYPPHAITLRSRGEVTNPRANAVVDIAKERHARALEKAAAERSLSKDELQKVHNYVDLLRQDWDREQRGLLPLMTEGIDEAELVNDDVDKGAKRSSDATSSIEVSRKPSLASTPDPSSEGRSDQQGSDSDDGDSSRNSTFIQDNNEALPPRRSQSSADRDGPESTQATALLASWWEQVPCLAHASEIGIDSNKHDPSFVSAAERKFLHRMSTARSSPHRRKKQDHRVYDWAPPVRRPVNTKSRKKSHGQGPGRRRRRRSPVQRAQSRAEATATQTTAAWEMKKATNPAAVAAEVALAAMKREAAIVAASARKAAPASPHAAKAASVLKAVEDAQARVAAEALKRERRSPGYRKACSRPPLPAPRQHHTNRRRKVEPQTCIQQESTTRCSTNNNNRRAGARRLNHDDDDDDDDSRSTAQGGVDDASDNAGTGPVAISVDLDGSQNPLVRLVAAIQKRAVGADKL